MKFGANSFIWVSPFSNNSLEILDKVKAMGFDVFEPALEEPGLVDAERLGERLQQLGLDCSVCGAFGPTRDLSSEDAAIRANAFEYICALVDAAAAVGAGVVNGPMYSAVGKARLLPPAERRAEWQRAVEGLRRAAGYAGEHAVRLAIEPLNRYETDMINTAAQGLEMIDAVGAANLGLHLDTFHMHLEEKDSAAAIRLAGPRLFHFHACENDRGVPGTGQVHWQAIAQALEQIDYRGSVVIESFTPDLEEIARAVCLWRPIAPDQDTIARDGLRFLKKLFGEI
ncbi:MAG: sugar phosphate isomerase/epimerase family protein [Anaerolineaceae bacterium]|jgi:D-psicose/D-tagatose/L-ribulose 3-epimerase